MDKVKVFQSLLDKFETDDIREYCKDMINEIPDYIFTMPSSTSLKYHNRTQCQPHGQIYHVLMFGEIMNYILELEYVLDKIPDARTRDCLRCTPIFHDVLKCGMNGSQHTVHEHPMLAAQWIKRVTVEHDIDKETKLFIARLCASHSGQWTENKKSTVILQKPENDLQFLVHLCDYLSSRQNLDMIYSDNIQNILNDIEMPAQTLPDINEWVIPFGKHKGATLPQINKIDAGYIRWAKENINSEPARSLLAQM
jgi:hypothetical protein